jgi:hypothetical protein
MVRRLPRSDYRADARRLDKISFPRKREKDQRYLNCSAFFCGPKTGGGASGAGVCAGTGAGRSGAILGIAAIEASFLETPKIVAR